jgi:uncharacterized protein (TIGR00725 family)
MSKARPVIGVIGGAEATEETLKAAYETGALIANNNAVLVCGGLGGVMEAASRGAHDNNGIVVGIIPGAEKQAANPWVSIVIPTGMGFARNALVVNTADVLIAFPGKFGTLSEIGLALNQKKTVVYLPGAWNLQKIEPVDASLYKEAFDAHGAVGLALDALRGR